MDFKLKHEMVKLSNATYGNEEAKKEYQAFILEHIKDFDLQAWDIFALISQIDLGEMKGVDREYWTKVYEYLKEIDCNDMPGGLRSMLRLGMLQTVCEEELGLKAEVCDG